MKRLDFTYPPLSVPAVAWALGLVLVTIAVAAVCKWR